MKAAVRQLKTVEAKNHYEVVVFDTFGLAWELAEKYVCNREGVSKVADIPFGGGLIA